MSENLGPNDKRVFVNVEVGGMEEMRLAVRGGHAQPQQAAGGMLQIARKVLSTHAGQGDLIEIGLPDDLARGANASAGHVGVVDDGVGAAVELDLDRPAAGFREAEGNLANPLVDPGRGGRAQGPDGSLEQDPLGDDIAAGAALDTAKGDHDRIAGIDRTRHELVNAGDELRGDADRVDRLVRRAA